MNNSEDLHEKYYDFQRFYFKDGYIDMVTLDSVMNPNLPYTPIRLNSFRHWYRYMDKEWVDEEFVVRSAREDLIYLIENWPDISVQDAWNLIKLEDK